MLLKLDTIHYCMQQVIYFWGRCNKLYWLYFSPWGILYLFAVMEGRAGAGPAFARQHY